MIKKTIQLLLEFLKKNNYNLYCDLYYDLYLNIKLIQKGSSLIPSDNSGVLRTKVFHVYKNSQGRLGFIGDFFKVSAKEVLPENPILKKSKHKTILVRSVYKNSRKDGSYLYFDENGSVLLKKRLTPRGTLLKGPISNNIRRKKFLSSFIKII